MWFALSLIALFVGYCWYDSMRLPFCGAGSSEAVAAKRDALFDSDEIYGPARLDLARLQFDDDLWDKSTTLSNLDDLLDETNRTHRVSYPYWDSDRDLLNI